MKKVLFVCIENSCRSQMAEGFASVLGKDVLEPYSAGSRPSGKVNPEAVKVMREAGVDISASQSKGFQELPVKEFDFVITMGCGDQCPVVPAEKHIDWQIEDPRGRDVEFFRGVRDNIKNKVRELVRTISLAS
jgi:arsenate reductase (thioredoxin)